MGRLRTDPPLYVPAGRRLISRGRPTRRSASATCTSTASSATPCKTTSEPCHKKWRTLRRLRLLVTAENFARKSNGLNCVVSVVRGYLQASVHSKVLDARH